MECLNVHVWLLLLYQFIHVRVDFLYMLHM